MNRQSNNKPTIFMAEQLNICLDKILSLEKLLIATNNTILHFDARLDDFDYIIDEVMCNLSKMDTKLSDSNSQLGVIESKLTGLDIRLESVDSRMQWTEDSIFSLQNQQKVLYGVLERIDNHAGCAQSDIKEIYSQLVELSNKRRLMTTKPG